jgi:hypothetical protein
MVSSQTCLGLLLALVSRRHFEQVDRLSLSKPARCMTRSAVTASPSNDHSALKTAA